MTAQVFKASFHLPLLILTRASFKCFAVTSLPTVNLSGDLGKRENSAGYKGVRGVSARPSREQSRSGRSAWPGRTLGFCSGGPHVQ